MWLAGFMFGIPSRALLGAMSPHSGQRDLMVRHDLQSNSVI